MDEAFAGADVVYPKSWGAHDLMVERVAANAAGDAADSAPIEQRALGRNAEHTDWICDERRMGTTTDGDALYMHCLPADIGAEVSPGVMERHRVNVAREANWKVYVVMALLAGAKVPDLADALASLEQEAHPMTDLDTRIAALSQDRLASPWRSSARRSGSRPTTSTSRPTTAVTPRPG